MSRAPSFHGASFVRTRLALDRGSALRRFLAPLSLVALLGAWGVWFFLGRVTVYERSDRARLEVETAAHPVESQVGGRVVATHLWLGKEIAAGDVLVELDREPVRLGLIEQRARLAALDAQIDLLRDKLVAERDALGSLSQVGRTAIDAIEAQRRQAEALAALSEMKAEREKALEASGAIAKLDLETSEADALRRRAETEELAHSAKRLRWEQIRDKSDRLAEVTELAREIAALEGEREAVSVVLQRLDHELENYLVRAPVSGILGEVAEIRVGSVLAPGEKLAAIVPEGALRIVARFEPSSAIGRVHPGQAARMRLDGFPWAQYGVLCAEVERVGSEVRDGLVRVDLAIAGSQGTAIPLQHGLPGAVEVEVERVAPIALALRAAGELVHGVRPVAAADIGGRSGR